MAILAVLCAVLIAAHSPFQGSVQAVAGTYIYWLVRIAIEALLFFLCRSALETYVGHRLRFGVITLLAIAISHIPFVLSITAMDIVLGLPELGMGNEGPQPRLAAFLMEMLFIADNHLALCLILSAPRLLLQPTHQSPTDPEGASTLLSALEPPLQGSVIWIEAQEHYVRVTTTKERRMVLARFSDVVRELSGVNGMQVHRSHWVLLSAIAQQTKQGQGLNLTLTNGDIVPVSRSYRQQLQDSAGPDYPAG